MGHIVTLVILSALVAALIAAEAFFALVAVGGASGGGFGCLVALLMLPPLILVVVLLIYSHSQPAQVTAYVALLAAVAGAFGWGVRTVQTNLYSRAELLIREALSRRPMDRAEIRSMIYSDNILFRIGKSTYIDALNNLLRDDYVQLVEGRYTVTKEKPQQM